MATKKEKQSASTELPPLGKDQKPIKYLAVGEAGPQGSQICPYHNCICRSKSEAVFTRFTCPVPGCTFAPKVGRPKARPPIPQEDLSAR